MTISISAALEESLRYNSFNPTHMIHWAYGDAKYLSRNDALTKAIIVNLNPQDVSFIPTVVFKRLQTASHKIPREGEVSIMCPLVVTHSDGKKAPDTILRRLFSIDDLQGLVKVRTGKGMDYIGGTGIIFDQNWNPLMMTGMRINKVFSGSEESRVVGPVMYVNPEVFTREDNVSRAIVKKLIPWYSSHYIYSSIGSDRDIIIHQTIRILVEDFSHMFVSPNPPQRDFEKEIKELCKAESEIAHSPHIIPY